MMVLLAAILEIRKKGKTYWKEIGYTTVHMQKRRDGRD
jgi:hypothetical protein